MSDFNLYRTAPITTGAPLLGTASAAQPAESETNTESFGSVLNRTLQNRDSSNSVSFSKHAAARIRERSIDLSSANLARLNQGVELARSKGLDDALILMDRSAFVVSAQNRTVITAVNGNELAGNVFTNIDGTVII